MFVIFCRGLGGAAIGNVEGKSSSASISRSLSKSFSLNSTAGWLKAEEPCVGYIVLRVSWKEFGLFRTDVNLDVDGAVDMLPDFLLKVSLIFEDLAQRGFEVFVIPPMKPPIDCED